MQVPDNIFMSTVRIIQSLPKNGPISVDISDRLKFYGLYKTIELGKNTTPKPSIFSLEKLLKWKSWKANETIPRECAKFQYVKKFGDMVRKTFLTKSELDKISNEEIVNFLKRVNMNDLNTVVTKAYEMDMETPESLKQEMMNYFREKILTLTETTEKNKSN